MSWKVVEIHRRCSVRTVTVAEKTNVMWSVVQCKELCYWASAADYHRAVGNIEQPASPSDGHPRGKPLYVLISALFCSVIPSGL